jgi:hypothetical protein
VPRWAASTSPDTNALELPEIPPFRRVHGSRPFRLPGAFILHLGGPWGLVSPENVGETGGPQLAGKGSPSRVREEISSGSLAIATRVVQLRRGIVLWDGHDRSFTDDRLQPLRSAVVAEPLPAVPEDDDDPLATANRARPGLHPVAPVILLPRPCEVLTFIATHSPQATASSSVRRSRSHTAAKWPSGRG